MNDTIPAPEGSAADGSGAAEVERAGSGRHARNWACLDASRTSRPQTPLARPLARRRTMLLAIGVAARVLVAPAWAQPDAPQPAAPQTAPPAVEPAPGPLRSYMVFFDWDRAGLSERARELVAEAARATTRAQVVRIEVAGHTDTSGTARYNRGLSRRRARNVASELVRQGVARGVIAVRAFGESRPLVPTGQGVREPQNRRVDIVLR